MARWLGVIAWLLVPSAGLAQASWYDAAELLAALRPSERAGAVTQAGLADASELPLYELDVTVADDLGSFTLAETLWYTNRSGRPQSEIVLRLWANRTDREQPLTLEEARCVEAPCTLERISPRAIALRLATPIAPGGRLKAQFRLRGVLRAIDPSRTTMMGQGLEGLSSLSGGGEASGDYGLLSQSAGTVSLAHFHVELARQRAGIWEQSDASTTGDLGSDELASFRASVRVPRGMRVVAVGAESAPVRDGERDRVEVRAALARDFTILAGRDLTSAERRADGVRVRSFFPRAGAQAGRQALDVAARALRLYARRFGSYPYAELDVVAAPLVGGAGGVEFTGLVTIASMFYQPLAAGSGSQDQLLAGLLAQGGPARGADMERRRMAMLELVTAHEVAHQWWHTIVGSDSRQHPFQDETLAQWSALYYFEDRYGAARARAEAEQQVASGYHAMRLLGRPDAAVDRPASAFGDPLVYGGLVYGKGPFLYPALRSALGDRAFFAAVADYARQWRLRSAPPRALFERMEQGVDPAMRDRVRGLVRRWLEEARGDEDLGQPDLGRMLGAAGADAAQIQGLLQMLQGQGGLEQLQGSLAQGSLTCASLIGGAVPPEHEGDGSQRAAVAHEAASRERARLERLTGSSRGCRGSARRSARGARPRRASGGTAARSGNRDPAARRRARTWC